MAWIVRLNDEELNTDSLTLDELEAVEKASGQPWSMLNPLREVASAKGLLGVLMVRQGMSDDEMKVRLTALTVADIKDAFDYQKDEEDAVPLVPVKEAKRPGSSSGPRGGSGGSRKKRAASA